MLLWWSLASIAVSLFVGAFLQYGRHETETLDLDLDVELDLGGPQITAPPPGVPVDTPNLT